MHLSYLYIKRLKECSNYLILKYFYYNFQLPHLTLDFEPNRKVSLNYDWNALFGKDESLIRSTPKETKKRNRASELPVLEEKSITVKNVKTKKEQPNNESCTYKEVEYDKEKENKESNKADSSLKPTNVTNKRKLSQILKEINRKGSLEINSSIEQKKKTMKVVQQQTCTIQPSYPIVDALEKKQNVGETLMKKQLTQEKAMLTNYSLKSLIADIKLKKDIALVNQNKNLNKEEEHVSLNQTSVSSTLYPLNIEIKQKQMSHEPIEAVINENTRNNNISQDIFLQSEINQLEDSNDSHNTNESYIG